MKAKRKSPAVPRSPGAEPGTLDAGRIRWLIAGVIVIGLCLSAFIVIGSLPHRLTAEDRAILDRYESIRAALAHDDLAAAKGGAAVLADEWPKHRLIADAGRQLAENESLETARLAFSMLSKQAIELAARNSGYYVMHCKMPCPMVCNPCITVRMGKWVQRAPVPENPFMGLAQMQCGTVDRAETAF